MLEIDGMVLFIIGVMVLIGAVGFVVNREAKK
jgi:hypothetical protein